MKFTVYILHSDTYSKHYLGFSTDLEQTLIYDNEAGIDWTSGYRPWKLIHSKDFETKKDALKYEKWLRSVIGKKFIDAIEH